MYIYIYIYICVCAYIYIQFQLKYSIGNDMMKKNNKMCYINYCYLKTPSSWLKCFYKKKMFINFKYYLTNIYIYIVVYVIYNVLNIKYKLGLVKMFGSLIKV